MTKYTFRGGGGRGTTSKEMKIKGKGGSSNRPLKTDKTDAGRRDEFVLWKPEGVEGKKRRMPEYHLR